MQCAEYINGEVVRPDLPGYMMPVDGEIQNAGNSNIDDYSVEQDSYGLDNGETTRMVEQRNSGDVDEYIQSSNPRADTVTNVASPYRRSHMYEELPSTTGYANGLYEYSSRDGVPRQNSTNPHLPQLDEMSAWEGVGPGVRESNSSSSPGTAVNSWIRPASSCRSSQHQPLLVRETPPGYRKRMNPLYSSSHTLDKHSQNSSSGSRILSLCVVFISLVAAFLSIIACIIAGLSISQHRPSPAAITTEDDGAAIRQLIKKMERLEEQQMLILKLNATRLDGDEDNGLSLITLLKDSMTGLRNELNTLSSSVTTRLQNISLTTGPQGPAGPGNLSGCMQQKLVSGGPPIPDRPSNTDWISDSVLEQQDKVITGVTCSTIGGTQAFLISEGSPNNSSSRQLSSYHRYRCNCSGVENQAVVHRFCIIHYWTCPLTS